MLQGWVLLAFEQACQRLLANKQFGSAAYAAVGEALFWACVCDEGYESLLATRYTEARTADYEGRVLRGVRWVRNRTTHQRAVVLHQHYGAEIDGLVLDSAQLDTRTHLKWRRSEEIPPGKHDGGRDVYDQRLSGQPVEEAVNACRSWFFGRTLNEVSKAAGMAVGELPGLPEPSEPTG